MNKSKVEKLLQDLLDNHYQWVLRGLKGTSTEAQTSEYLASKKAVLALLAK